MQQCKSGQASTSKSKDIENMVSYEADIQPLMAASCTPCHFPENGKKEMLHTYDATRLNIKDIIARVEMNPEEKGFMPFKSKKPPLTDEQIQMFRDWLAQGFPE